MISNCQTPLAELAENGFAIYERLKRDLEPDLHGKYIAIHVPSGEYAVDSSTARAMRAIRKRHDSGQLFLRRIGPEPELGLLGRILGGEMRSGTPRK